MYKQRMVSEEKVGLFVDRELSLQLTYNYNS